MSTSQTNKTNKGGPEVMVATAAPVNDLVRVHRGEIIALAVVGVLLGIVALFWPGATLLTIALIFGAYLIAAGIVRITAAFVSVGLSTGMRWLTAILGLAVTVAGVLVLANPYESLIVLAWVIGIAWIANGIADIANGARGAVEPRWLAFVAGGVSVIAGIVMFLLPQFAIEAFLLIGAILLIVVSAAALLTLPRQAKAKRVAEAPKAA